MQTTEGTGSSTAPDYGVAGAVQIRSAPGGGIHPGFGAGPDLQQLISYNQANGLATVSFDQLVAPGSATSGDCGGPLGGPTVYLVTTDGQYIEPRQGGILGFSASRTRRSTTTR